MKAVIFCDNDESALMPITGTTPKFILPICGRYAIHYVLDSVNNYDITHVYLISNYHQDKLNMLFKSSKFKNVKLSLLTTDELMNFQFDDDIVFIDDIKLFDFNLFETLNHQHHKSLLQRLLQKLLVFHKTRSFCL